MYWEPTVSRHSAWLERRHKDVENRVCSVVEEVNCICRFKYRRNSHLREIQMKRETPCSPWPSIFYSTSALFMDISFSSVEQIAPCKTPRWFSYAWSWSPPVASLYSKRHDTFKVHIWSLKYLQTTQVASHSFFRLKTTILTTPYNAMGNLASAYLSRLTLSHLFSFTLLKP